MCKKIFVAFFIFTVLFSINAFAVKVNLPAFKVTLNGVEIDSKNRDYPFVVYNDITYFPMTYHDCDFLGVRTKWDGQLNINKTGTRGAYHGYPKTRDTLNLIVTKPNFNINVNGKSANENDKYSFLLINDITYFPLTWDFAVNEFGWEYYFDSENGLVINSNKYTEKVKIFRVIGYYSADLFNEPLDKLQTDKLTHIMYAFLIPQKDGSVLPLNNPDRVKELTKKAHKDNCKVYIAVGGWSYNNVPLADTFELITNNDSLRKTFVHNIMEVVSEFGFDGVELDWEYPTENSKANYEKLILELSENLKKEKKHITAALNGAWSKTEGPQVSTYISKECLDEFEFINVMCYDTNNEQHSPFWFTNTSIDYWLNRGVSSEKIVVGMPLYARPSWLQYRHIIKNNPMFAYSDSAVIEGSVSYYNGLPTLCKKTVLAINKAGGVMLFDVNEDVLGEYSVVSMIDSVVNQCKLDGKLNDETLSFIKKYSDIDELLSLIK